MRNLKSEDLVFQIFCAEKKIKTILSKHYCNQVRIGLEKNLLTDGHHNVVNHFGEGERIMHVLIIIS